MNLGRRLVTRAGQRRDLADHNQVAGERARRAAAYAVAVSYLETSLGLLSREEWAERPEKYFDCCRMHAECVFLSGHVERASALCEELFGRAHDKISRASAYCLKASMLEHQSLLAEACDTIRIALRDLDVELPTDHAAIDREIGAGIGKMQGHLAKTPIEDLVGLPAMTDRVKIATMDLLFQIIPPASQWYPPLFILADLIIFDLTLTHGTTPASSKNFVDCGIVLNVILRDSAAAYRMGRAAFAHLERHSPTPLESPVNFVFGCFISHWGAHYGEGLEALARSHQRGIELGDVQHAAYAIVHRALRLFFAGRDLAECKAQTDRAEGYCREAKAVGQESAARILQRALAQLDVGLGRDDASDEAFTEEIRKTGNAHFLLVLAQTQTMVHFILGDLEAAGRWEALASSLAGAGNGTFPVPDHYLYRALLLSKKVGPASGVVRDALLTSLAECQEQLRVFADASPANYAHKHKLASAEIARARGDSLDDVLRLHGEALAAAGDDFLHLRAVANELLGDMWREKGYPQLAKGCVFEAYYLYRRWGARAKLARMEHEHSAWLASVPLAHELSISRHSTQGLLQASTSRETVEANSLDLASALKASHAVSSEVRPDRLYAVLMDAMIENAGAQHGFLIVDGEDDDEPVVAARASVDDRKPAVSRRTPLSHCDGVAQEIVRYVARTRETVVLDDAREDTLYGDDPHVVRDAVKSVLCLPVLNQGKLVAILYVENNVVTHAFTPKCLGVLHVIAGQAAISIVNAALYENLERRVADRTRELTERNREVTALLNSMHQGIFTIDDKHRVQPQYSAHLRQLGGPRDIQGADCMDLLFRGSTVGPDPLKTMRSALLFSFDVPSAVAEANLSHMARELTRPGPDGVTTSLEIEWTPIVDNDDTVRKMLVTVRDVTVIKQLRASSAQAARELDIVGQILDAGVDRFRRFCSSARGLMRENRTLLQSQSTLVRATLDGVLRDMHTVKGNARMLGLSHVAKAVHSAEDRFQSDRQRSERVIDRASLVAAVDTVLDSIDGYEWVCERKLGDAMRPREAGSERAWDQVTAQIASARRGSVNPAEALGDRARAPERGLGRDVGRRASRGEDVAGPRAGAREGGADRGDGARRRPPQRAVVHRHGRRPRPRVPERARPRHRERRGAQALGQSLSRQNRGSLGAHRPRAVPAVRRRRARTRPRRSARADGKARRGATKWSRRRRSGQACPPRRGSRRSPDAGSVWTRSAPSSATAAATWPSPSRDRWSTGTARSSSSSRSRRTPVRRRARRGLLTSGSVTSAPAGARPPPGRRRRTRCRRRACSRTGSVRHGARRAAWSRRGRAPCPAARGCTTSRPGRTRGRCAPGRSR